MPLSDFLTTLVRDKFGDTSVGEVQVASMAADLAPRLNQYITTCVMTELAAKNPAFLPTFEKMSRSPGAGDDIRAFVEKEIPDGAAFLAKTLDDFRSLYLGPTQTPNNEVTK